MPKKKPPKNAFSFYLDEAIVDLKQRGIGVRTKQDAVPHVHHMWKEMSDAEKAPYEDLARQWKLSKNERPFRSGRLDCTGNPLENRIDMDKVILDQRKEQKKYLLDRWQALAKDQVLDEHFYFISFQSFFEFPNEEGYQPCEIACVDYSLRTGINREWHAMINPGPIKMGMGAESKIFSEQTHKIPIWGFKPARTDHFQLWRELLEFVDPKLEKKVFPPLFCKISELKKNTFCMDYLAQLAGVSNRLSKIYQWEGLASVLYVHAGIQSPSINIIEDGASTTMYDYEARTKCDYHDEIESVHCAMLTIKKCCFWMSDAFTKIFDYEITENHLPVRQAPQYTIIHPDDLHIDHTTKKKFLGASSAARYDPNLPLALQKNAIPDCTTQESSTLGVTSSSYGSRDIRYRPKYHLVEPKLAFGRGLPVPGAQAPLMTDDNFDTKSTTDTIDDVASSILSDTESDATCQADDEGSVYSYSSINRAPKTKPFVVKARMLYNDIPPLEVLKNDVNVTNTSDEIKNQSGVQFKMDELVKDLPNTAANSAISKENHVREDTSASTTPQHSQNVAMLFNSLPMSMRPQTNNAFLNAPRGRGRFLAMGRGAIFP